MHGLSLYQDNPSWLSTRHHSNKDSPSFVHEVPGTFLIQGNAYLLTGCRPCLQTRKLVSPCSLGAQKSLSSGKKTIFLFSEHVDLVSRPARSDSRKLRAKHMLSLCTTPQEMRLTCKFNTWCVDLIMRNLVPVWMLSTQHDSSFHTKCLCFLNIWISLCQTMV